MLQAAIELAAGIPLLKTLGIQLVESGDNHAVMQVIVDERHLNYFGGAHDAACWRRWPTRSVSSRRVCCRPGYRSPPPI